MPSEVLDLYEADGNAYTRASLVDWFSGRFRHFSDAQQARWYTAERHHHGNFREWWAANKHTLIAETNAGHASKNSIGAKFEDMDAILGAARTTLRLLRAVAEHVPADQLECTDGHDMLADLRTAADLRQTLEAVEDRMWEVADCLQAILAGNPDVVAGLAGMIAQATTARPAE